MDVTSTPLDVTKRISEPSTHGILEGIKDQSSSIFPGFMGILVFLLIIMASCILRNWNKQKKRQVPYFQVTPLLTLPRSRRQVKNVYDLLPRQREDLGRHQSSSQIFTAESLLTRNSDSPGQVASQADDALQVHRVHIHAMEYTVGIYDNAMVPQVCGQPAPSAHYINVRASRDSSSISSEESNDYVNIPAVEETPESLTSINSMPSSHFLLPSTQEAEFTAERHAGPETKGSDALSGGEGSSQSSNDYINMTGLDLGDIQENQAWETPQCCRDYENVPSADLNGSQQQDEEEVTSSNTEHGDGETDHPATLAQPVRRALSSVYYTIHLPAQNENSQTTHGEERSEEDSPDYEKVLVAELGGRDWDQGPGT